MNSLEKADAIAKYLTEMKAAQAVLINGEWGVGKSYFIREILQRKLKERGMTTIIYSLYGLDSLENVREDLVYSILQSKLGEVNIKGKKLWKKKLPSILLEKFPSAIKIVSRHFDLEKSIADINDALNLDLSKIVIVFDDLERAAIDINLVLGFINGYVENTDAKVIIIANENEIGTAKLSTDLPLKYLVASNPFICLDTAKSEKNKREEKLYTYDELVQRTHRLFSNDIRYSTIKEKLIGLTVAIDFEYNEIYDELIKNYSGEQTQKVLFRYKLDAINLFKELKCSNLRTIIFFIMIFDKIYQPLIDIVESKTFDISFVEKEISSILEYTIVVSYYYKKGMEQDTDTKTTPKSIFCLRHSLEPYSFVDHFVYYHQLDENIAEEVKARIEEKIEKHKAKEAHDSLSIFDLTGFNWLYLDDETIETTIRNMYDEMEKGEYDDRYFKDILAIFFQMDNYGYIIPEGTPSLEEFIKLMEKYISSHDINKHFLDIMEAFGFDELKAKYSVYIHRLRQAIESKENIKTSSEIDSILNTPNWEEAFFEYCNSNSDHFITKKHFLTEEMTKKLIESLTTASNRQIIRLCDSICRVYDFGNLYEFFKDDAPQLKDLIAHLEKMKDETMQKSKTIVIDLSISRLQDKYNIICP